MELYEETVIDGHALNVCLDYLKKEKVELNSFTLRRFITSGSYDYYLFIDGQEERNPDCPMCSMYSRVFVFVLDDRKIVSSFDGFWIDLKNFMCHDNFRYYLKEIDVTLQEKADLLHDRIRGKLIAASCSGDKEPVTNEELVKLLSGNVLTDPADAYVFIGNHFRFDESVKDSIEVIEGIRMILLGFIDLSIEIEDRTPEFEGFILDCAAGVQKTWMIPGEKDERYIYRAEIL